MNYATLLTLLRTPPVAEALQPVAERLRPHVAQLLPLLTDFRSQPVTPAATQAFELRLQELLRAVGLALTDGAFHHLEDGPLPDRREADGER